MLQHLMASLHQVLPTLELLDIGSWRGRLSPVYLPKLLECRIRDIDWSLNQLEVTQFFYFNRQIERLSLYTTPHFNITDILAHLLDLRKLKIVSKRPVICEISCVFGMLRQLHTLTLKLADCDVIEKILRTINANGIPVKRVTLNSFRQNYPMESIVEMKSIEYLKIHGYYQ